jgi:hypothetical protein
VACIPRLWSALRPLLRQSADWKRFSFGQAAKYEAWENRHAQFNVTRALQMIIVFVELPIGIATTLAIPIHAAFSDDEIRIGHFGSLRAAKHPYSDLKRVFQADGYRLRDGSFKYCPAVILHFSDGTNWSSANNSDCKPLDEGIVSFVEGRAHTQSLHIEVLPRSALLGDSTIDLDKVDSTHR